MYRKVTSSRLSQLVAHSRIFKLGKFDAYVLWPLAKRVQNWIVDWFTARDFTVVCVHSSIAALLSQLWALKVSISYSVTRTVSSGLQKIRGYSLPKLCHQGAICWLWKELFWQYGLLHKYFWNTTFLFVKILFDLENLQLIQITFYFFFNFYTWRFVPIFFFWAMP